MDPTINTQFYMKFEHVTDDPLKKREQNKIRDNPSRMGYSFKDEGVLDGVPMDFKKQIKSDSNFARPFMAQNYFPNKEIHDIHEIAKDNQARSLNE